MPSDPRGLAWRAVAACLLACLGLAGAVAAQTPVVWEPGQTRAAPPTLRMLERTERSLTYEVIAHWPQRLQDAVDADLDRTLTRAGGAMPWLAETIRLHSRAAPRVTVLSAEYDEIALPFALDDGDYDVLVGPAAAVERVGLERRQPTGTFVARLLQIDRERGTLRRYHRMRVRVDLGAPQRLAAAPMLANPHLEVSESVLAVGTWFKVPVTVEGVYRIDRAFLSRLGLNPARVEPSRVRVFGNLGAPLPALNRAPRIADLAENPVLVIGGGDGRFDEGDAVFFFARAASGWRWDVSRTPGEWRHYINPFSVANYYFIRVDGPGAWQIPTAAAPGGTPTVVTHVDGRIFIEEDLPDGMVDREWGGSGLDWLGRDLNRARPRVTVLDTLPPDLAAGTVRYRSRVALQSPVATSFAFQRGESVLAEVLLPRSVPDHTLFTSATRSFAEPVVPGQRLRVELRMLGAGGSPTGWIDFITAIYPQELRAHQDYLRFATPGGHAGVIELVLTGFSGEPEVWDVTTIAESRRLPVVVQGNTFRVRLAVSAAAPPREIVAFRTTSPRIRALDAQAAARVPNQNLHGLGFHPDYVIVAPAAFMRAAERLAAHRARDGLTPLVVDIEQVFNEFSGGQRDPRGLRDFLRFLYDRAPGPEPALRYVLLFGDGNYDYRGIRPLGREHNFIPTYQTENSASFFQSYTSDDYFGLLDPDEGEWPWSVAGQRERVDIGIGRLPARTAAEADAMVDKIIRYDSPATFGAWRTRYTVLADDHLPNAWDRDLHVQNAEFVAATARAYEPALNLQKIYLGTYSLQQTALGARYPGATADALRSLEQGTLVWNYSGHGGPGALADERLITREHLRALGNSDRLTVAVTATCSFGRFDLRDQRSGGEEFILNPAGGAVAIFTTVRVVHTSASPSHANLGLNITLNRFMFTREAGGRPPRLGAILQRTKAHAIGAQLNNRKFNLLGDPAMRFGLPERRVEITRINGVRLGEDGAPVPALRALELARIEGRVLDPQGQPDAAFSGEVEVLVFDVARTVALPPETNAVHTDGTFTQRSDLIYRGRASVAGGAWAAEFIVPRDISYAGAPARIAAHVAGAGTQGMGFTEEVLIGAESGAPLADREGPRIRLYLNDTTFVHGGLSGNEPLLIARLEDESGINMAGVGVGHEMLLVINGNEAEAINVGPFYQSDLDSFRSGTLRFRLPRLSQGPNSVSLTAWDVVNNSATATLDFVVEDGDRLRIEHAFPYPNPTTGPTRFVFEHNQVPGTPAAVQIRIYTLAGRPVRTLDGAATLPDGTLPGSPVQIPWDGRDEDFHELATGIYLYRVRVEVDHGDGERRVAERIERLAIIR